MHQLITHSLLIGQKKKSQECSLKKEKTLKNDPKTAPKLFFLLQELSVHAQRGTGVVCRLYKCSRQQTEVILFFWDFKNFTSR